MSKERYRQDGKIEPSSPRNHGNWRQNYCRLYHGLYEKSVLFSISDQKEEALFQALWPEWHFSQVLNSSKIVRSDKLFINDPEAI